MIRFVCSSAAAAAAVLCLFTVGCGSSGSTGTTTPPPAAPTVSSLSPASVTAGSAGLTLTVTGANFVPGAEITWAGTEQPTLYVSGTSLQAYLTNADLAAAATIQVGVDNPSGNGGNSASTVPFLISADNQPNPVPVLTSVSPDSAAAQSESTTVTLTGSDFVPASSVLLNGTTTLSTAYESSTSLTATIPSSSLLASGTLTLSVVNPPPGGGTSSTVPFTVNPLSTNGATAVNIAANDLAWDPVNQVIYLSLPSADGANGNSIQVLNPTTGTLGTSVYAGSEPDLLAVSRTSQYLYAALDGSSSLQRFKLPSLATDINISFGPASFYGSYIAMDLQASPAADGTVAFVLGTPGTSPEEEGGVQIYDSSVERPNALCGWIEIGCTGPGGGELFDSIQWNSAASEMYMLNNEDTGFDFYEAPVTASGFGTVTDYGALAGGFGDMLHYDGTTNMLYTDDGVVINPATGEKAGQIDASGLAAPDGANGLIFYLGQTQANLGGSTYTIESFDINHLTPVSTMSIENVNGVPTHFIRWGTNGLAFTTETSIIDSSPGEVYLISGSFVTTNAVSAGAPAENVRRTWNPVRAQQTATRQGGSAQ